MLQIILIEAVLSFKFGTPGHHKVPGEENSKNDSNIKWQVLIILINCEETVCGDFEAQDTA